MPTRRALAVLLAAALVLPVAALTSAPAASGPAITFGSPVIVDPIHTFGEPDIRINGQNMYVSGPWGTGTQRSIWDWSQDGGQTFRALHSSPISTPDQSATTIMGPGGGDTEISIDHTGKVYYADLAALTTLKMATWDPSSHTMQTNTLLNVTDMKNQYDRQWFALWDPTDVAATRKASHYTGPFPVNYLTWNGNGSSTSYSLDGLHYGPSTLNISIDDDGPLVIDQLTGTVIQAIAPAGSGGKSVGIALRNRDPSGQSSDPALRTSKVIKAADLPKDTVEGAIFTVIAMDEARNVYLVWCTQNDVSTQNPNAWQIWYAYAPAAGGWTRWSKPVRLSAPPSRQSVMPWAVAGSKGRLAAVWYGTEDDKDDPSSVDSHQPWNLYLAMVTNADTAHPTVQQVKVTKHPMHYGTICFAGLDCIQERGNRNMADFFEVVPDPATGAVVIVYDDTSNELIQTIPGTDVPIPSPIEGTADHRGAAVVTVARQNGGIGLFGKPIVSASAFGPGRLVGPTGNASFDPVYNGAQVPALDAQGVSMVAEGNDLVFKVAVKSLADTAGALSSLDAGALDWVVRWIGDPVDSPTGVRNPIYYAAVEVDPTGTPTFFAGTAHSTDLCSVSACDPHIIEYPAPPLGGTAVTGTLVHGSGGRPDSWEIRVPRDVVGSPKETSLFESLAAYTMVRNKPASLPTTNLEAEAGLAPVVVDGICCIDTTIAASRPIVLGTTITHKTAKNTKPVAKPAVRGGRLAATGVPGAPVVLSLSLIVGAFVTRRVIRRV